MNYEKPEKTLEQALKEPMSAEEIRIKVLRDSIQWEKLRTTFDEVVKVLKRHRPYDDLGDGYQYVDGTLRIQQVKTYASNVSASILLNVQYLGTDIIAELNSIGRTSFGVNAVSSIGMDDGFLSIHISTLENKN